MKQTALDYLLSELQNVIELYKTEWEELDSIVKKAKEMEKEQAQMYATFCLRCMNENLPLIKFEDWIKLNVKQELEKL